MDPKDYHEWTDVSGLYLANHSHLDRYQTLARQLSPAGLNTLIASEFLSDISQDMNVSGWRTYSVYEMAKQQTQRIEMTAAALEEIGAVKTAAAVRTAKSESPFDALMNLDLHEPEAMMKAMQGLKLPDMLNHLKQSAALMMPELAAKGDIGAPRTSDPSAEQLTGETRSEVERMLAEYAAAHDDELRGDLERHGDPRTVPGYSRKQREKELVALRQRQIWRESQREDIPVLRDLFDQLQKLPQKDVREKKGSKSRDTACKKLLQLVKKNRQLPCDWLLPDMTKLLDSIEEFIAQHSEVFHPPVTSDGELQASLAAIGQYETDTGRKKLSLHWDHPAGLSCEWGHVGLTLRFSSSAKKKDPALRALLAAVQRIQQQFAAISNDWRRQLIEHFRIYEVQMSDWELEAYEQTSEDDVTEASILDHAGTGTIVLEAFDAGEEITAETSFPIAWDDEHGFQIEWEVPVEEGSGGQLLSWGKIVIRGPGPTLAAQDLAAFQQRFHLQLPDLYRQFLLARNGGCPNPNHVVLRQHGQKLPFNVESFHSLHPTTDSLGDDLEAVLETARRNGLPDSLLPIARISFVAESEWTPGAQLCLALSGQKSGRILLVPRESPLLPWMGSPDTIDPSVLQQWMTQVYESATTVAKNLNDLFDRLQAPPVIKLPVWLQCIGADDVEGFLEWLEAGGELAEEHKAYGEPFAKSVVDYLALGASPRLIEELIARKSIKPSVLSDSWQRYQLLDVVRFRELMPVFPTTLWPVVLASPRVWSDSELLQQLVDAGVDVDRPLDEEGRTALHLAVESGNQDAVRWLMQHGADPQRTDNYDRNAFLWGERGPGFECLPILRREDIIPQPTGIPSPDAPGIAALREAADKLAEGCSLIVSIQIRTPAVTRVEQAYGSECHYRLSIDVVREQLTLNDMASARQDYLQASEWPGILFAPIVQWPQLTPLWETLEVRELEWQQAMRKRKYVGPVREDLLKSAQSALEQAFSAEEAAKRGVRLRKP